MTLEAQDSHFGIPAQMHVFNGAENLLPFAAAPKHTQPKLSEQKAQVNEQRDNALIDAIEIMWKEFCEIIPYNIDYKIDKNEMGEGESFNGIFPSVYLSFNIWMYLEFVEKSRKKERKKEFLESEKLKHDAQLEVFIRGRIKQEKNLHSHSVEDELDKSRAKRGVMPLNQLFQNVYLPLNALMSLELIKVSLEKDGKKHLHEGKRNAHHIDSEILRKKS
ncbi:MAG: hypothetical protein KDK64_07025 [Chlamydiia bacterium]|nr:hypothetical protein [Chlamydiia bacterium]